jgi:hypothetical protein
MDDMNKYYKASLLANLCSEYRGYWQAASHNEEKLVRLAMSQQAIPHVATYAYKGDGLTKDYIKSHFGEYINGKYIGIDVDGVKGDYKTELYVGYDGDLSLSDDVTEFMWCNVPSLEIETCKATKIYVACDSDVHIVCGGYNSITVMLFDNSRVVLDDIDEESSVVVYSYGNGTVEYGKYCLSKNVKCFNKELRL